MHQTASLTHKPSLLHFVVAFAYSRAMAQIYPAESATNDPLVGGFVARFPSGATKSLAWRSEAPIQDTLAAAKEYTVKLLDVLLKEGRLDDAERTNWASFTAGVQKVIQDWNEKRRAALYADAPTLQ